MTNSTPRKGDGDLGDVLIGLGLSVSDSWLGTIFGQKSFVGTSFYDPDTAGKLRVRS